MEVNKLGDIGLHTGKLIEKEKQKSYGVSSETKITYVNFCFKEKMNEKMRLLTHMMILLF